MSELAEPDRDSSRAEPASCPECQSLNVRPSQSSYPRDIETNAAGEGSFWRCRNCGGRFLGPLAESETKAQRRHRHRHGSRHSLSLRARAAQMVNRWTFPVIVVLTLIVAVILFLDFLNAPRPRLGFPD